MIRVLLQFHLWSWKNRIRTRLRRLRQIRYLISFSIGTGYVLLVWRPWARSRLVPSIESPLGSVEDAAVFLELGYAALLTLLALLAWLWPRGRAALSFTETEIAFLFPAPLTRRQVIDFSILKGQAGILMGAFFFTLFALRGTGSGSFLQGLLGAWVAFSTMQLYFLGSAITRSNLLRHGRSGLRRAAPAALAGFVLVGLIAAWSVFWLRPPAPDEREGAALAGYLLEMAETGPMRFLLAPGRWLVRPALVQGTPALLASLVPALLLLAAGYAWVVRSDFAYEEASAAQAAKAAAQRADRRSGRRRYDRVRPGSRRSPFPLAPRGRPELALLWKNLIATGRFFSLRRLGLVGGAVLVGAALLDHGAGGTRWTPFVTGLGTTCAVVVGFLLLAGPAMVRSDMRSDLLYVSLLKQYPLPGWSLVLGEVLAPALLVTGLQILLLAVVMILMEVPLAASPVQELMLLLAFAILAGPLNLLSALVQNATVLLFPSWMTLGPERARGLEAFGQRLVAMFIRLLALALIFLPALLIVGLGLLFAYPALGIAALPVTAAIAAGVSLAEGSVGVLALGALFDRFDPSRELDVAT